MFIAIDEASETVVEGFKYSNKVGNTEYVKLPEDGDTWVRIVDSGGETIRIYVSDIPKLVKALEAAKKQLEQGGN